MPYWTDDATPGREYAEAHGRPVAEAHAEAAKSDAEGKSSAIAVTGGDPHLRSTRAVRGSHIRARDGEVGHVEDFIVDDDTWIIRYLVIDTRNWLPGKTVLVAPQWVESIDWEDNQVVVDLMRDEVRNSPKYDPSAPIDRSLEAHLYDYYGRPTYWQ